MAEGTITQGDKDAILKVFESTLTDIPDHEFDDWLGHWTDDARLRPPGVADVVGHQARQTWMRDWPKITRLSSSDL